MLSITYNLSEVLILCIYSVYRPEADDASCSNHSAVPVKPTSITTVAACQSSALTLEGLTIAVTTSTAAVHHSSCVTSNIISGPDHECIDGKLKNETHNSLLNSTIPSSVCLQSCSGFSQENFQLPVALSLATSSDVTDVLPEHIDIVIDVNAENENNDNIIASDYLAPPTGDIEQQLHNKPMKLDSEMPVAEIPVMLQSELDRQQLGMYCSMGLPQEKDITSPDDV